MGIDGEVSMNTEGLRGLAAIEDYAVQRPADKLELDWVAVKDAYMNDAHIARFMDDSGLTKLMEPYLPSIE